MNDETKKIKQIVDQIIFWKGDLKMFKFYEVLNEIDLWWTATVFEMANFTSLAINDSFNTYLNRCTIWMLPSKSTY